jgi:hypothetical protein
MCAGQGRLFLNEYPSPSRAMRSAPRLSLQGSLNACEGRHPLSGETKAKTAFERAAVIGPAILFGLGGRREGWFLDFPPLRYPLG